MAADGPAPHLGIRERSRRKSCPQAPQKSDARIDPFIHYYNDNDNNNNKNSNNNNILLFLSLSPRSTDRYICNNKQSAKQLLGSTPHTVRVYVHMCVVCLCRYVRLQCEFLTRQTKKQQKSTMI